jgi:hypothetical protein
MSNAVVIITWITLVIAVILMLVSTLMFRRKGEAELSQSLMTMPTFISGGVLLVVSIITKIVLLVIK